MPTRFVLLSLMILSFAIAREVQASQDAEVVVDKLMDWLEKEKDLDRKITYKRLSKKHTFDSDGKVEEKETSLYHGVIIDDKEYERLVETDGEPIVGEDLEKERKREAEFRSGDKKKDEGISLDEALVGRYSFFHEGVVKIRGRDTHKLSFSPRTDVKLPDERKEDAVLNALEGRIWVDSSDWALARVHASLKRTVRLGWGILATLHKVNLKLETKRSKAGVWHPYKMSSLIWGRTMVFKPIRVSESSVFYDIKEPTGA